MPKHIQRNKWKYAGLALVAGTSALNWPWIKQLICQVLCTQ